MEYPSWWEKAEPRVNAAVEEFVIWTKDRMSKVKPQEVICKNPFLFRARAPEDVGQLADRLIDAFFSSSEETEFGNTLEKIAIAICAAAKGGRKSSTQGIDLEYDVDGIRTIVQVKSGIKWGNSGQIKKMKDDFEKATIVLRQGSAFHDPSKVPNHGSQFRIGQITQVRAVEGICYGPSQIKDRGSYFRIVGKHFWNDISDWEDSGTAVLDVVGQHARNGLRDVRKTTRKKVKKYLRKCDAANKAGEIKWPVLFDLIMTPTRNWPKF